MVLFGFLHLSVFGMIVHNIEIGDLVRYRQWEPGDPTVLDIPESRRGWGDYGPVISIIDWIQGTLREPCCGIVFLNQRSELILARAKDLEILESSQKIQFNSKTAL